MGCGAPTAIWTCRRCSASPAIAALGAQLIAISPQTASNSGKSERENKGDLPPDVRSESRLECLSSRSHSSLVAAPTEFSRRMLAREKGRTAQRSVLLFSTDKHCLVAQDCRTWLAQNSANPSARSVRPPTLWTTSTDGWSG